MFDPVKPCTVVSQEFKLFLPSVAGNFLPCLLNTGGVLNFTSGRKILTVSFKYQCFKWLEIGAVMEAHLAQEVVLGAEKEAAGEEVGDSV